MSSTPMTPGTRSASADSPSSSPPSSPPSADLSDAAYGSQDKAMRKEEEKLEQQSARERERERKRAQDRLPVKEDETQLQELDWFLSRSQGFSSAIMDQLKKALDARKKGSADQPKLITGGKMREYQLEGLTWLTCLYQIGLNGILADEMGLGKTVQLISFLAFLREQGTNGPFLILGPLSTVRNWVNEFMKWTPKIPVIMYHGNPQGRAQIRRQKLKGDSKGQQFPVVCTSYEICMRDKKYLSNYQWKFIVVDEGHRLKNFNCKLVKELKQYTSESRLILTGTPLQNNLAELWSLLNFLLPEAFADLEHFESMFDFSDIQDKDGHKDIIDKQRKAKTVASLHAILKPFLLRRVKGDVETSLPPKREYILYAPLTATQKELYRAIKDNDIREYLEKQAIDRIGGTKGEKPKAQKGKDIRAYFGGGAKNEESNPLEIRGGKRKAETSNPTPNKSAKSSRSSTPAGSLRSTRRGAKKQTYEEVSDQQYFKQLEEPSESSEIDSDAQGELDRSSTLAKAKKEVALKKLGNPVMQLRLACNSPHMFSWPWPADQDPDTSLIASSGKMLLLDRLLPYLFKNDHKVLIFSQFSRQLDILEDYASVLRGWKVCRIDGSVKAEDRQDQIDAFNESKDHRLFLLSTRAGGLGINLTAADTVILYDSDWNPQQDLQAQDRAHRIGQTRPVVVYRLATKGTVEQTLLEKADGKRRLEKLVIQKDKFRSIRDNGPKASGKKAEELSELQALLAEYEDDFENYEIGDGEVLTEQDLKVLTDRSEKAYQRAAKGLDTGEKFRTFETKGGGSDVLGGM